MIKFVLNSLVSRKKGDCDGFLSEKLRDEEILSFGEKQLLLLIVIQTPRNHDYTGVQV